MRVPWSTGPFHPINPTSLKSRLMLSYELFSCCQNNELKMGRVGSSVGVTLRPEVVNPPGYTYLLYKLEQVRLFQLRLSLVIVSVPKQDFEH